jgi:hypothetical protein
MGSVTSASHEWIELHNQGTEAILLDGWTLSDGGSLSIALAGTVPAEAYAVLERTSDATAPGTAFLVYTGALVNTGTTLVLRRSDGTIADQVAGGENWQTIGGDNVTKDTAQLTTRGWQTGAPTPGQPNTSAPAPSPSPDPESPVPDPVATSSGPVTTVTSSGRGGARTRGAATPLPRQVGPATVTIKAQTVAYVNQLVPFSATVEGVGPTIAASLKHVWNFGDFTTATGSTPNHAFAYPGTYVVTLWSTFARQRLLTRHEITVLPVTLSLTRTPAGTVQVHNNAPYDIDVSRYRVVSGSEHRQFPPHSLIMAKQTVTIPNSQHWGEISVYDAKDQLVVSTTKAETAKPTAMAVPQAVPPVLPAQQRLETPPVFPQAGIVTQAVAIEAEAPIEMSGVGASVSAATTVASLPRSPGPRWPFALLALLILALAIVLWRPARPSYPTTAPPPA